MCIATTKKAAGQLQKILNKLGEFGGVIETDNPGTSIDFGTLIFV